MSENFFVVWVSQSCLSCMDPVCSVVGLCVFFFVCL